MNKRSSGVGVGAGAGCRFVNEYLNEDREIDDDHGGCEEVLVVSRYRLIQQNRHRNGDLSAQSAVRHYHLIPPCQLHQPVAIQNPCLPDHSYFGQRERVSGSVERVQKKVDAGKIRTCYYYS